MVFPVVNTESEKVMDYFLSAYPYRYKPFLHQAAYLERFWEEKSVALFADMGTGKSFMLIRRCCPVLDKGKIDSMLVVAPKGVYRNWYTSELPKHLPDHVPRSIACWSPLRAKQRKQRWMT
jgi:reverse gyrase